VPTTPSAALPVELVTASASLEKEMLLAVLEAPSVVLEKESVVFSEASQAMERTRKNEGSRSRGGWIALKRLKMRTGSRRRLKEMLGKMSYTTLY
jgi:hypothetical protein